MGSWEWGVDSVLPGIIMWADPAAHFGEEYRQEYHEGETEDRAKVLAVNESVTTPFGAFAGCVRTEDRNALDPGPRENKWHRPQVGFARGGRRRRGDGAGVGDHPLRSAARTCSGRTRTPRTAVNA